MNKLNLTVEENQNKILCSSNSIKVLQMTDLHINSAFDMPITFSMVKKLIYGQKPDLIVFTGDVFSSGCSKTDVDKFICFIEEFKTPWAVVLGNHDDETPYSLSELGDILTEADYSIYKNGSVKDMFGNYFYNIHFEDAQQVQLIFMDTRHDGFTKDSVDFYETVVNNAKADNNGKVVKNFMFYHIPPAELVPAIEELKQSGAQYDGKIDEPPCVQINNVGFFDKVLQLQATIAMIYGHDHFNNLMLKYKGVDFCYGVKTGPSASNDKFLGGVVYSITSEGEYTTTRIFI